MPVSLFPQSSDSKARMHVYTHTHVRLYVYVCDCVHRQTCMYNKRIHVYKTVTLLNGQKGVFMHTHFYFRAFCFVHTACSQNKVKSAVCFQKLYFNRQTSIHMYILFLLFQHELIVEFGGREQYTHEQNTSVNAWLCRHVRFYQYPHHHHHHHHRNKHTHAHKNTGRVFCKNNDVNTER